MNRRTWPSPLCMHMNQAVEACMASRAKEKRTQKGALINELFRFLSVQLFTVLDVTTQQPVGRLVRRSEQTPAPHFQSSPSVLPIFLWGPCSPPRFPHTVRVCETKAGSEGVVVWSVLSVACSAGVQGCPGGVSAVSGRRPGPSRQVKCGRLSASELLSPRKPC